jgi:hypothetical protein
MGFGDVRRLLERLLPATPPFPSAGCNLVTETCSEGRLIAKLLSAEETQRFIGPEIARLTILFDADPQVQVMRTVSNQIVRMGINLSGAVRILADPEIPRRGRTPAPPQIAHQPSDLKFHVGTELG